MPEVTQQVSGGSGALAQAACLQRPCVSLQSSGGLSQASSTWVVVGAPRAVKRLALKMTKKNKDMFAVPESTAFLAISSVDVNSFTQLVSDQQTRRVTVRQGEVGVRTDFAAVSMLFGARFYLLEDKS